MKGRTYKTGERADKTGLTVRTIRYYDEIGLLIPPKRIESGYRLYGIKEPERLQKILSLKYFRLKEVKDCLEGSGCDLSLLLPADETGSDLNGEQD